MTIRCASCSPTTVFLKGIRSFSHRLRVRPTRRRFRWIFYTSGTSADPKGVCHTDETVIAAGHAMVFCHALTREDVGSIGFPVAHAGGPQYLASMLEAAYPALLIERFSPEESLPILRSRGVTVVGGGTAFYSLVLAEQRREPEVPLLPTLRILTGGGAPKPPQLYYDVLREVGRPILHGLGMTESPCITMGRVTDTDEQLAFTEGLPVPGMQVRIVDGEIQLKGACCTVGYVDPALSAALFTADGWLRGGDLGQLRDDGHLIITGRQKDVIIRKGENISAREVEELLLAHPLVGDVAVIGLPDPERGELVCAVIEGVSDSPALEFAELVLYLRGTGLTLQKIPERLEVLPALPRNAFSKVSKAEAASVVQRELHCAMTSVSSTPFPSTATQRVDASWSHRKMRCGRGDVHLPQAAILQFDDRLAGLNVRISDEIGEVVHGADRHSFPAKGGHDVVA